MHPHLKIARRNQVTDLYFLDVSLQSVFLRHIRLSLEFSDGVQELLVLLLQFADIPEADELWRHHVLGSTHVIWGEERRDIYENKVTQKKKKKKIREESGTEGRKRFAMEIKVAIRS